MSATRTWHVAACHFFPTLLATVQRASLSIHFTAAVLVHDLRLPGVVFIPSMSRAIEGAALDYQHIAEEPELLEASE